MTSQGKAGEALALLNAAIAACPGYAEAHNNMGVLQRDVGAISDALASYNRALELTPDSRNAGGCLRAPVNKSLTAGMEWGWGLTEGGCW